MQVGRSCVGTGDWHRVSRRRTSAGPWSRRRQSPRLTGEPRGRLGASGRARRKPFRLGPSDLGRRGPIRHAPAHTPAARTRPTRGAGSAAYSAIRRPPVRMAGYDSYAHTREHARHHPQAPRKILSDRPRPVSVWESVRRSNTARPCGNRLVDPFRSQQEHGMEYGFADRPEPASAPGCLDRGRGGEPACRRMWAAGQPVPAGEAAESAGVGPTSAMAPGRKRATGQQASTRHAAPAANPGSRRRSKIQRRGQPKWLPRCRR